MKIVFALLLCGFTSITDAIESNSTFLEHNVSKEVMISYEAISYVASIRCRLVPICTGSFISEVHVLTSAHCIYGIKTRGLAKNIDKFSVWIGIREKFDGMVLKIKDFEIHPEFVRHLSLNDIGLLLIIPINTLTLKPILPATSNPTSGMVGVIKGWIANKDFKKPSRIRKVPFKLNIINSTVKPNANCTKDYKRIFSIYDVHLCANLHVGDMDSLIGPVGSPLVHNASLIGIASWSYNMSGKKLPTVFTRVFKYLKYIDEAKSRFERKSQPEGNVGSGFKRIMRGIQKKLKNNN